MANRQRDSPTTRLVRGLRLALFTCLILVVVVPALAAYKNLHRARRPILGNPGMEGHRYLDLRIRTDDGLNLDGWYMPPDREPEGGIILCHGVAANRRDMYPRARFLTRAGYACLLFDLRAHGTSEGDKTTYGLTEAMDIKAALAEMQRRLPGKPIGLLGQSMGAAASILAARQCPEISAYVLDSSFASLWEMAREKYKKYPSWLLTPFQHLVGFWGSRLVGVDIKNIAPERVINDLMPRPVLFIHGEADDFTPLEHSRRLHRLYQGPKAIWTCPAAGHVESHQTCPDQFEARTLAHFRESLQAVPAPSR